MANGCPIFRYAKHKAGSSLASALGHHLRLIPTHNADPERTPENQILYGLDDRKRILEAVKKTTEPLVKRKDANRAVELFLGASDEFWENGGDWAALGKAHLAYLKAQFGEKNIIGMGVHLDETTPHFWAIVTPIHDGKLRSNHWFDGPKKCREFVDKAVPFFEHLGMVRSRENVKANHIEIATWHQAQSGNKAAQRRLEREHKKRLADAESRVLAAEMRAEKAEKNAEKLQIELNALRVRRLMISEELEEANAKIQLQKTEKETLEKERDSLMKEQQRVHDLMASLDIETRQRVAANADKFQAARKKFMP
ncbi:MAG: plasmid recombination protein [Comamonas sp.]|nr:plasmid recombination protein [Comamonas sp.]